MSARCRQVISLRCINSAIKLFQAGSSAGTRLLTIKDQMQGPLLKHFAGKGGYLPECAEFLTILRKG